MSSLRLSSPPSRGEPASRSAPTNLPSPLSLPSCTCLNVPVTTVCAAVCSERQRVANPDACCATSSTGPDGVCDSAALTLVNRRWRRVFNTSTLLHATLNLNLHHLEAQLGSQCSPPDDRALLLRLLTQRGRATRRLWLHSEGVQLRMASVLQLMSPKLQAVYLGQGAPDDCLAHLHRFPSLRSLDLPAAAACGAHLLLPAFSGLEELTLREGAPELMLRWGLWRGAWAERGLGQLQFGVVWHEVRAVREGCVGTGTPGEPHRPATLLQQPTLPPPASLQHAGRPASPAAAVADGDCCASGRQPPSAGAAERTGGAAPLPTALPAHAV